MSEQGLGVTNYMIALVAELKADVRRLEAERDQLKTRLVEEAQRGLKNGQARMKVEAERDALRDEVAALQERLAHYLQTPQKPQP